VTSLCKWFVHKGSEPARKDEAVRWALETGTEEVTLSIRARHDDEELQPTYWWLPCSLCATPGDGS